MHGWPFLIARGRRRGYSVLLAPAFLRADYGLLEEVAGPVPANQPVQVATARTSRGEEVCVAWSAHLVTAEDLADGTEPRDEHSRPLRLLYGFACQRAVPASPSDVDMARSLTAAMATYRRFLADEQRFTVESSAPFDLRSPVSSPRPSAPPVTGTRQRRGYAVPLALAGLAVGIGMGIGIGAAMADDSPDLQQEPTTCTESATKKKLP